jgi:nucleoside-diphosphate-sugar epimerase
MRILIIGGTRFMGPAVVAELVRDGHEVAVFHRGKTAAELPAGLVEYIGDRDEIEQHIAALLAFRPDVVLDMVAFTEESTQRVVDLLRGKVGRLVVASSCDVYRAYGVLIGKESGYLQPCPLAEDAELRPQLFPFRGDEPRAADDPQRFLDDYDKILVERVVLSAPDLPAAVLRLPMVYGPHDFRGRLFPYLKRIDDGRPAIVLSAWDAKRRFARGFVDNVAHAIALAVLDDSARGVYNVSDEPMLTELEWVSAIAEVTGWGGRVMVFENDKLPESLRFQPESEQDLAIDTRRIRAELGYAEVVPLREALARTVECSSTMSWRMRCWRANRRTRRNKACGPAAAPPGAAGATGRRSTRRR